MAKTKKEFIVIDPAMRTLAIAGFNHIARLADPSLICTYHAPVLVGFHTLQAIQTPIAGILILGSYASPVDQSPWQKTLSEWIKPHWERSVPTLGLCFGHQWIAHELGGKIGYLTPSQEKRSGFYKVTLQSCAPFKDLPSQGELFFSHREEVVSLPECLIPFASSPECGIEALAHKTLPLWGFQAHLEATPSFKNRPELSNEPAARFEYGSHLLKKFLDYCAAS